MLWEAAARLELVSSSALPPLSDVVVSWIDLIKTGELTGNTGASLYRAAMGLFLAIVVGAALGIFMAWSKPINVLLSPLVEIFYPLPKSALIPVTVIWLGFGNGSKILLIFLGCMIPVTIGAFNGARSSEQTLVWSARSMGANRLRMLWDVVLPSAMPELLANGGAAGLLHSSVLLRSTACNPSFRGNGWCGGCRRRVPFAAPARTFADVEVLQHNRIAESEISGSVRRVLVMCVCTASVPGKPDLRARRSRSSRNTDTSRCRS